MMLMMRNFTIGLLFMTGDLIFTLCCFLLLISKVWQLETVLRHKLHETCFFLLHVWQQNGVSAISQEG